MLSNFFLSFRLIQCENEIGKLLFLTEIPELLLEDPSEAKESLALQETSIAEPLSIDGSPGLKSVLSTGRSLNSNCDTGEKPMVTFKENIKPREINREQGRIYPPKDVGRERRDFSKGIIANKNDGKKDNNKRKNETKKCSLEKMQEAGKQNVAVQVSVLRIRGYDCLLSYITERCSGHGWAIFCLYGTVCSKMVSFWSTKLQFQCK